MDQPRPAPALRGMVIGVAFSLPLWIAIGTGVAYLVGR
jgi:hypothetical protein